MLKVSINQKPFSFYHVMHSQVKQDKNLGRDMSIWNWLDHEKWQHYREECSQIECKFAKTVAKETFSYWLALSNSLRGLRDRKASYILVCHRLQIESGALKCLNESILISRWLELSRFILSLNLHSGIKLLSKTACKATPLEFSHLRHGHISELSVINQKNFHCLLEILAMHKAMLTKKPLSNQTASSSGHQNCVKKTEPDVKSA